MPCNASTARTHLRKLPLVARSASLVQSLSVALAEGAADARHAARAAVWLRANIHGEPSVADIGRALKATSVSPPVDRKPNPACGLCFGVGYVRAEPIFREGQSYSAVRECSCWEVIA